jgi:curved DNA-binding protein CbpA
MDTSSLARDLYSELGVSRGAGADEIRKAFRKLAKENHPDTNPGNKAAEERFKKVSAAFDILGDPEKKKKYDAGEIDADGRETARGFAGGGPWGPPPGGGFGGGGPRRSGGFRTESFEGVDLNDILGEMFGGGGGGRAGQGGRGGGFGGFSQRGAGGHAKPEGGPVGSVRGGREPRRQAPDRVLGRAHHRRHHPQGRGRRPDAAPEGAGGPGPRGPRRCVHRPGDPAAPPVPAGRRGAGDGPAGHPV